MMSIPKPLVVRQSHHSQTSASNKSSVAALSAISTSPTSLYSNSSPKCQMVPFQLEATPTLPSAVRIREEQLERPHLSSPLFAPAMFYQRIAQGAQQQKRRCNCLEDTSPSEALLDMRDKAVPDGRIFVNRECRRIKASYDEYRHSEDLCSEHQSQVLA